MYTPNVGMLYNIYLNKVYASYVNSLYIRDGKYPWSLLTNRFIATVDVDLYDDVQKSTDFQRD